MNLAIVQKEVEAWPLEEQDRLAAYLATLRLKRKAAHAEELSRRLDDRAPDNWLSLDEVRGRLRGGESTS